VAGVLLFCLLNGPWKFGKADVPGSKPLAFERMMLLPLRKQRPLPAELLHRQDPGELANAAIAPCPEPELLFV